ncbi:hypothetical protein [Paenibacillus sp. LjRoot56]|uniref:hypothetical protein n=1 Tax=Paenibacillus sp. LjRoot56 TaxID=3342333 RepID=UPI003ECF505B
MTKLSNALFTLRPPFYPSKINDNGISGQVSLTSYVESVVTTGTASLTGPGLVGQVDMISFTYSLAGVQKVSAQEIAVRYDVSALSL